MKIKSIIGILLIILSMIAMYFWETKGRERLIYTKVLAAAVDLNEGDIAGEGSFKEISVSSDSLILGYMTLGDAEKLYGKECIFPLKENSLVFGEAFQDVSEEGESIYSFVIPGEWIFKRSSDIKAQSHILMYALPSEKYMGRYEVRSVSEKDMEIKCSIEEYFSMAKMALGKEGSLFLPVPDI